MIGKVTSQGIINGCKMEDGELMYLVTQPGDRAGVWLPAKQAIRKEISLAQKYKYAKLHAMDFGRQAQAAI